MSGGEPPAAPGRGALAIIASLAGVREAGAAAAAAREAMRSAYWDERDVATAMAIAYAGAGRLLSDAAAADPAASAEIRSDVKGLVYDLASFTWPGWDEPGISITEPEAAAGLAAARANLAMAVDLEKGDLPTARAHWMLGAHLLTAGDHAGAVGEFGRAEQFARRAGAEAEAELAVAFRTLGALAAGDETAGPRLEADLQRLGRAEGGGGFVSQVETVRRLLDL